MALMPKLATGIEKYKKLSIPVKAALWYTICNIIQKSLSFLVTPIFTRIMSKEDFGLYTVYNSWYWVVVVFATLNLCNGIFNNGMQDYKESRDKYTSVIQTFGSIAAIICFLVYYPLRGLVERLTGLNLFLCSLMFFQAFFSPALLFWQGRQRFEYRYRRMIIITLLIAVFRPSISAIAVILSHDKGLTRVVSYVVFEICVGFVFYLFHIFKGKAVFDKTIWKSAFLFAIPLIPHYLSQTFLVHLDKIMIDRYTGRENVSVYEIAYTVAMVATFINTSINNSLIPWIYDHLEKKNTKDISRISNGLLLIVACINFIIVLFAKEVVFIIGGEQYIEATYLIPVLSWSVFFMFLYCLFGDIEFYYKKTTYTMYGSVIACIINAITNLLFIKMFGYQAAAYTTLMSYIVLALAHYFFVKRIEKKEGFDNIFDYRSILIISIVGTIISLLSIFLFFNDVIRYLIIVSIFVLLFVFRNKIKPYIQILIKRKRK